MFTLAETTIVTQVVMHFSIMAATFPCFRQFLQAFNNDFGATTKMVKGADDDCSGDRSQGGRQSGSNNNSYAMSVLRSRADGGSAQTTRLRDREFDAEFEDVLLPMASYRDGLLTPADDGRSLQSMGSDRAMIKTKQKRA